MQNDFINGSLGSKDLIEYLLDENKKSKIKEIV